MAFLGDQAPGERVVIIAGQPIAANKGSACIAAIGLDSPHDLKGPWLRQSSISMSSVVVLPGQQQFATGGYFLQLLCINASWGVMLLYILQSGLCSIYFPHECTLSKGRVQAPVCLAQMIAR